MRFLHTSDWHIGKTYKFVDDTTFAVLQEERVEVISRIGKLAGEQDISIVLVAGDIYDIKMPSDRTLRQPVERMRSFPNIQWHLIPGNHDPAETKSCWNRLTSLGMPSNVHVHLTPTPFALNHHVWLLPSVVTHRHMLYDPTKILDEMETPPGAMRIGLAHGSIKNFGSVERTNTIPFDRFARAGLSYLALGDWHTPQSINTHTWYSGTPEIDEFGGGGGNVLRVELQGGNRIPIVTPYPVGRFLWHRITHTLHQVTDVDALENRIRSLDSDLGRVLVHATLNGNLSFHDVLHFENRIEGGLGSALRFLRLQRDFTTRFDHAAVFQEGFVGDAVRELIDQASDETNPSKAIASRALSILYTLCGRQ